MNKNRVFILGMAILILSLGLMLVGCGGGSGSPAGGDTAPDTIPSYLQGTWRWDRGAPFEGHIIVRTIGGSTVRHVEVGDPGSQSGDMTFSVSNVTRGATTTDGWTTYTFSLVGFIPMSSEVNAARNQLREQEGGYVRIFYRQ